MVTQEVTAGFLAGSGTAGSGGSAGKVVSPRFEAKQAIRCGAAPCCGAKPRCEAKPCCGAKHLDLLGCRMISIVCYRFSSFFLAGPVSTSIYEQSHQLINRQIK